MQPGILRTIPQLCIPVPAFRSPWRSNQVSARVPLPDDYWPMRLDACDRRADLRWSEHFLPVFEGQHLHAYCDPLSEWPQSRSSFGTTHDFLLMNCQLLLYDEYILHVTLPVLGSLALYCCGIWGIEYSNWIDHGLTWINPVKLPQPIVDTTSWGR